MTVLMNSFLFSLQQDDSVRTVFPISYLACKRNNFLMHATAWKWFEAMMLSEMSQSQKAILYNSAHMKYLNDQRLPWQSNG